MWQRTEHISPHFVFNYNYGLFQVMDNAAATTTTTTTTIEFLDCYAA